MYVGVPIRDDDYIVGKRLFFIGVLILKFMIDNSYCHLFSVPPLENFVMNRVLGDYFETLLYKIFVSIDEHTNIAEVCVTTCLYST